MKRTIQCLQILLFLSFSFSAVAGSKIIVATDIWENYSEKDGSGYYIDVMKAIFESQGVSVEVKYVPYAR